MSRIQILPEDIAAKIAAGEVVERPASVVKELVENSLDAEASEIEVLIEDGGKKLIEIRDNGIGMEPDEMRLALQRHATSKIKTLEDLQFVQSFGFRGEALPSIAAVSDFTLRSRTKEKAHGFEINLNSGNPTGESPCGMPEGTVVSVKGLFGAIPARQKFLRKAPSELAHILDVVTRLAFSNSEVGFRVTHDGKLLLHFSRGMDLRGRIAVALGKDVAESLVSLKMHHDVLEVVGFVAKPTMTRGRPHHYLFVNKRSVKDRLLTHAVHKGYETMVVRERYPIAVLFLKVWPELVDVNVHPQKAEVRFSEPRAIYDFLVKSIQSTLCSEILRPFGPQDDKSFGPKNLIVRERGDAEGSFAPLRIMGEIPRFARDDSSHSEARRAEESQEGNSGTQYLIHRKLSIVSPNYTSLKYLGQAHNTYLICQRDQSLVFIDQHAAHERFLFEKIKQGSTEVCDLLVPEPLELGASQVAALSGWKDEMERIGFSIEIVGEGTIWLRSHPSYIKNGASKRFKEMAQEFLRDERGPETNLQERFWATVACHSAVRKGDVLTSDEVFFLFRQMDSIPFIPHCPHGRPIEYAIPFEELEKKFYRK